MSEIEHFDVLIVGAGISGVGAAYHLTDQCPDKTFVILETMDAHGGTWKTHTYPGIRSDSDLYTFGYRFKPWKNAPVAEADLILDYMGEVIEENKIDQHIRYNTEISAASWSEADQQWTVSAKNSASGKPTQITCNFFFFCGGYYDHKKGYTPEWPGMSDFKGLTIHPQNWPEDTDLKGKKVVLVGSGATAATMIPSIVDDCAHVTMLQRSPTFFWTGENRNELADRLRALDTPEEWVHSIVRKELLQMGKEIQDAAAADPEAAREEWLNVVREHLGDEIVEKHFTPKYRPWQQRLAYVPDGDLFDAMKGGKASIVTDNIARFTEKGILTESGEELEADIIITATGFNLLPLGGIEFDIDGEHVDIGKTWTHRGIMMSGLPNLAMMFGYLRSSWTLRVDIVCDYICRLLNYMDNNGASSVMPTLRPEDEGMTPGRWISEEDFNPGYLNRGVHLMPKSGENDPWNFTTNYYKEREQMPEFDLDDATMVYARQPVTA